MAAGIKAQNYGQNQEAKSEMAPAEGIETQKRTSLGLCGDGKPRVNHDVFPEWNHTPLSRRNSN